MSNTKRTNDSILEGLILLIYILFLHLEVLPVAIGEHFLSQLGDSEDYDEDENEPADYRCCDRNPHNHPVDFR